MKYLPLIWAGIWRKPTRTLLTLFALAMAFVLFGTARGVNSGFDHVVSKARADRLFVNPRFGAPLPIAYKLQIEQIPGIKIVVADQFIGGYYQEPKKQLFLVTQTEGVFDVMTEYKVKPADLEAWKNTRTGIFFTKRIADPLGLKAGDRVTIHSNTPRKDGSVDWTFDLIAVIDDEEKPGYAYFSVGHYDYINEERASGNNSANFFNVLIDDPRRGIEIAKAIDALFANSGAQTRTQVESIAIEAGFANLENYRIMLNAAVAATLFALLLLTTNTMMQSFRERTGELAVLKTLGFSDRSVLTLLICEAVAQCLVGAAVGLTAARYGAPAIKRLDPQGFAGFIEVPASLIVAGIVVALVVALVSAAVPAWRANQLVIVDALAGRK